MFARSNAGASLAETVVTAALVLVILSLFVWFMVVSMQTTSQGATRMELQQAAVFAADRMACDLRRSAREGITLYPEDEAGVPVALAAVPLLDVDARGHRIWDTRVIVFHWSAVDQTIRRREWSSTSEDPAALSVDLSLGEGGRLSEPDVLALAAGGGRPIADRVVRFNAQWTAEAVVLSLRMEKGASGKKAPLEFEYEKVVALRQ